MFALTCSLTGLFINSPAVLEVPARWFPSRPSLPSVFPPSHSVGKTYVPLSLPPRTSVHPVPAVSSAPSAGVSRRPLPVPIPAPRRTGLWIFPGKVEYRTLVPEAPSRACGHLCHLPLSRANAHGSSQWERCCDLCCQRWARTSGSVLGIMSHLF